ncbi:hypothetical protein PVIIG_05604 [Plasmodium vivax India VII]|uniref:VIR protein n=1 Tax=Plasmodium vivax India VII TaxID=1077284 RepID=A0A0J9S1X8_PLAVI|nr:hypothetical protein PVIIG_05604 [Plasmodium vivax India VII]
MENSNLMKNYPFLDDIWNKYNFDKAVDSDESSIISLCNNDITYKVNPANEQKNICKKLLRNLKLLHSGNYMPYDFVKYCKNINYWLYYEIKEHNISDDIINNMFAESNKIIEKKEGYPDCSYFTFKKDLLEPEKLVTLRIFNNNIDNIREILINKCDSNICSCQKFINQCVDLYTDLHKNYCSNGDVTNPTKIGTCDIVNKFRTHYDGYLPRGKIKYEFPVLSYNTPTNIIGNCQSEETVSETASPLKDNQSDSSIIQNASHALAAMAGIPPFLVLIYKVNITIIQIYEHYLKYTIIFPCSIK